MGYSAGPTDSGEFHRTIKEVHMALTNRGQPGARGTDVNSVTWVRNTLVTCPRALACANPSAVCPSAFLSCGSHP